MKKILLFIYLIILMTFSLSTQSIPENSKITVAVPMFQNGNQEDSWIPLFIQGQLTTDFQNYSDFTVIDRQAACQILGEQAITEQAAFMNNQNVSIEYATNVNADFLVSVQILKIKESFSLNCSVQNVKDSSTVGKSYSIANVLESSITDGTAIHKASYELLRGLGISESKLAALQLNNNNQAAEVTANYYTAKGINAEQSGGNIIEAMAYYQKAVGSSSVLTESAERLNNLTENLSNSNLREQALNEIALHKKWEKIWRDLNKYIDENCAFVIYSPVSLQMGNVDFEKERVDMLLPVGWKFDPICHDLYTRVYSTYMSSNVGNIKNTVIQNSHFSNKDSSNGNIYQFTIYFSLYDENGNLLGKTNQKVCRVLDSVNGMVVSMLTIKNLNPNKITDKLKVEVQTDINGGTILTVPTTRAE